MGYDVGDPLLDRAGAEAEVVNGGPSGVRLALTACPQLRALWDGACSRAAKRVELKLFRYNDTRHHNVWAVNYITKEAYLDGYDYFFRVNDDSEFRVSVGERAGHTRLTARQAAGWTSHLVEAMQMNEDFGAAGGRCSAAGPLPTFTRPCAQCWTPRTLAFGRTPSSAARTLRSLGGSPSTPPPELRTALTALTRRFHFPFSFGNWWSDDWITFAYSRRFSLWLYDVDIHHHQHMPRYVINWKVEPLVGVVACLSASRTTRCASRPSWTARRCVGGSGCARPGRSPSSAGECFFGGAAMLV